MRRIWLMIAVVVVGLSVGVAGVGCGNRAGVTKDKMEGTMDTKDARGKDEDRQDARGKDAGRKRRDVRPFIGARA